MDAIFCGCKQVEETSHLWIEVHLQFCVNLNWLKRRFSVGK